MAAGGGPVLAARPPERVGAEYGSRRGRDLSAGEQTARGLSTFAKHCRCHTLAADYTAAGYRSAASCLCCHTQFHRRGALLPPLSQSARDSIRYSFSVFHILDFFLETSELMT